MAIIASHTPSYTEKRLNQQANEKKLWNEI